MPPVAEIVAVPVDWPKQFTFVWAELATRAAAGSEMVALAVVLQPLSSVTVTKYVPAVRPVAVAALPPAGDHA